MNNDKQGKLNDDTDYKQRSRREVLKTAALGSGIAFTGTAVGRSSSDDEVEIVTHKSADGPEKTKYVPKSWLNHYKHAVSIRKGLKKYHDLPGVASISITGSDEKYGGKSGFIIKVEVDNQTSKQKVPDEVDGIQVKKVEPVRTVLEGCSDDACYNDSKFDPTPGGVTFDGATSGSHYYLDYDNDGTHEKVLLTANHVVGSRCDDNENTSVEQNCNDWGTVVESSTKMDVAAVNSTSSYAPASHIEDPNFDQPTIAGFVTENGLADMESSGETIYNYGIMTGENQGQVEDLHRGDSGCGGFRSDGVKTGTGSSAGDSGCPEFAINNGDAYIISIHSVGYGSSIYYDCQSQEITPSSGGTAAYEISNAWDGYWTAPI